MRTFTLDLPSRSSRQRAFQEPGGFGSPSQAGAKEAPGKGFPSANSGEDGKAGSDLEISVPGTDNHPSRDEKTDSLTWRVGFLLRSGFLYRNSTASNATAKPPQNPARTTFSVSETLKVYTRNEP